MGVVCDFFWMILGLRFCYGIEGIICWFIGMIMLFLFCIDFFDCSYCCCVGVCVFVVCGGYGVVVGICYCLVD